MSFLWRIIFSLGLFTACHSGVRVSSGSISTSTGVTLVVLGTVQDAGSPQAGCMKDCCKNLWRHPDHNRKVTCLGLIDAANKTTYLLDATPHFPAQLKTLNNVAGVNATQAPTGIFLTHAHIGHYTGLMYLGREAMNTSHVPVYAMPRMDSFLQYNGPWSQLVRLKNIAITPTANAHRVIISNNLSITPIQVPHRDEYSETAGFIIKGNLKTALFIPDIDKWSRWNKNLIDEIARVDYAYLDATFFDAAEIGYRDISAIPHPFVIETMELCKNLPAKEKNKIHFIHFNHTNPLLNVKSKQAKQVLQMGFHIAQFGEKVEL